MNAGTEFMSRAITLQCNPGSGFVFRSKLELELLDPSGENRLTLIGREIAFSSEFELMDPSVKNGSALAGCEIALGSVVLGPFGLGTLILRTYVD